MAHNVEQSLLGRFEPGDVVLIDADSQEHLTRDHIIDRADYLRSHSTTGDLAFVLNDGGLASARDFHALFEAGIAFALLDAQAPEDNLHTLLDLYSPELVVAADDWQPPDGWRFSGAGVWQRQGAGSTRTNLELGVLLTTSGSTGSPKFVRASRRNILANAAQITQSLAITPTDLGVTTLPVHYSFGLSVLTSHAMAGSAVLVSRGSVIEPAFWQTLGEQGVTMLAGVPQTYLMLKRLGFAERLLPVAPRLRALLQAGGRLEPSVVKEFASAMATRGGEFFVMYGQTEAVPRMAYVPPHRLTDKPGSAGIALTGGRLSVRDDAGELLPVGAIGQVHYQGPNVMMGYAQGRSDLSLGDEQGDTLPTGDLGYIDPEGYVYLTGRLSNFAKVAGVRVSLDEVERLAAEHGLADCVAVETQQGVITLVHTEHWPQHDLAGQVRRLTRDLRLPARSLRLQWLAALPLLTSGKVDYSTLAQTIRESANPQAGNSGTSNGGAETGASKEGGARI